MAGQRVRRNRLALGVDKSQCAAARQRAPFKIALKQAPAFAVRQQLLQRG